MTAITISGGVYHESVVWPVWDRVFGSGGRAAAALYGHVDEISLVTYARSDVAELLRTTLGAAYKLHIKVTDSSQAVSFDYVHCLSTPTITPPVQRIRNNAPLEVQAEAVLRFGMMEGTARVLAKRCVYDPQSPALPEPFAANGSSAEEVALVINRHELTSLTSISDLLPAAESLIGNGAAAVVVIKCGPAGAVVVSSDAVEEVPAYQSEQVWTVGSGDVFAAMFAAQWAVHMKTAAAAAHVASRAVASYANSMSLPLPSVENLEHLELSPARVKGGRVYIASPFFSMSQRWLVDEARQLFRSLQLDTFSPVHDVGPGKGKIVAPLDLEGLGKCDRMFAVLDGLDSGTIFEVGYARAQGIPVYALAQTVADEDLKMIDGSGCRVYGDFATAVYHTAWCA